MQIQTSRKLALLLTFAPLACNEPISTPIAGNELTEITADNVQYEMRSVFTAEGVRAGVVNADSAFIFADSGFAKMYEVNITFEDSRGAEQARVVADSGVLKQRTEEMDAWGNVVIDLPARGCRIVSEEIHYSPPLNQIRTDKPVTFEQNGQMATGAGFYSDLQMQNFTIQQPSGIFSNICNSGAAPPPDGGQPVAPGASP
jgi:LPS export ABC transporter protein LptC